MRSKRDPKQYAHCAPNDADKSSRLKHRSSIATDLLADRTDYNRQTESNEEDVSGRYLTGLRLQRGIRIVLCDNLARAIAWKPLLRPPWRHQQFWFRLLVKIVDFWQSLFFEEIKKFCEMLCGFRRPAFEEPISSLEPQTSKGFHLLGRRLSKALQTLQCKAAKLHRRSYRLKNFC